MIYIHTQPRLNDLMVFNAEKDKVNNINLEEGIVDAFIKYKNVRLFEIKIINFFF